MAKNHKQNSNFQITYFLAGACHTADGAYAMLCDLKEERESAIKNYAVSQLKEKAKKIRAEKMLDEDEATKLEGQADLLEIKNNLESGNVLYEAALAELHHIEKCIEAVQPLRKYKNYSDLEAHELAQENEWKLELIHRAENYMITSGTIPSDHFVTMRMHPAFKTEILPRIEEIQLQLSDPSKGKDFIMKEIKNFELPILEARKLEDK